MSTRLQIGMNVYMKHAGSFYFSFVVCFIMPFNVKCSTANTNIAKSDQRANYTPSLLRTNIPRLREITVKNKRRWWIAQEGLFVGG